MRLDESRCLVLGAGGFLGTNLSRALLSRVPVLKAFGRRGQFARDTNGMEWVGEEFLDSDALGLAVKNCDVVFHLLGTTTPASADADKVADLTHNAGGTLRLLEHCRLAGVKRVVFVSSGGTVYGRPVIIPTPESVPPEPLTAYGVSKFAIEKYLQLYEHSYGLEYRVLRVANPYGPYQWGQRNQGAIATFMKCALAGQPVQIWGDGSTVRDYVYVDDVVSALMAAANHEGPARTFNIGSGVGRSLLDLVKAVERVSAAPLPIEFRGNRSIDVPVNVLNVDLAAAEMSWVPRTPFEDGIRMTWDWLRKMQTQRSGDERFHA